MEPSRFEEMEGTEEMGMKTTTSKASRQEDRSAASYVVWGERSSSRQRGYGYRSRDVVGNKSASTTEQKICTSFSIQSLLTVFATFNKEKIDLVQGMGFQELLNLIPIKLFPRQLALWLIRNLDTNTATIRLRKGVQLMVTETDVEMVIGIPRKMQSVKTENEATELEITRVREILMIENGQEITLECVGAILKKDYGIKMGITEMERFKVAFVLYVDALFLAPKGAKAKINQHLFGNLTHPEKISEMNWCGYVLNCLIQGSRKVSQSIRAGNKTVTLEGCLLFIVVFYLDNVDFGNITPEKKMRPRFLNFTKNLLSTLEREDKEGVTTTGMAVYGRNPILGDDKVIYTRTGKEKGNSTISCEKIVKKAGEGVQDIISKLNIWGNVIIKKTIETKEAIDSMAKKVEGNSAICYEKKGKNAGEAAEEIISEMDKWETDIMKETNETKYAIHSWLQKLWNVQSEHRVQIKEGDRYLCMVAQGNTMTERNTTNNEEDIGRDLQEIHELCYKTTDEMSKENESMNSFNESDGSIVEQKALVLSKIDDWKCISEEGDEYSNSQDEEEEDTESNNSTVQSGQGSSMDIVVNRNDKRFFVVPYGDPGIQTDSDEEENYITMTEERTGSSLETGSWKELQNEVKKKLAEMGIDLAVLNKYEHDAEMERTQQADLECKPHLLVVKRTMQQQLLYYEDNQLDEDAGNTLIINDTKLAIQYTDRETRYGISPFAIGMTHQDASVEGQLALHMALQEVRPKDLIRMWYVHIVPDEIKIRGLLLKKIFQGEADFDITTMDAVVRLYNELDNDMYSKWNGRRWRHFLPTEFAVWALNSGREKITRRIEDLFIGPFIDYKVEECRLVMVPVMVHWHWTLYTWDFKTKTVAILDPRGGVNDKEDMQNKHKETFTMIHSAMKECISKFHNEYKNYMDDWGIQYISVNSGKKESFDSGLYTMFSARYFDGEIVTRLLTQEAIQLQRVNLLYQLLSMKGNIGTAPQEIEAAVSF